VAAAGTALRKILRELSVLDLSGTERNWSLPLEHAAPRQVKPDYWVKCAHGS
jgi:hypothetical protein